MPIFAALLAKFGPIAANMAFNLLIAVLKKTGVLNPIEAQAVNTEHALVHTITHLKTYSAPDDFPKGKNSGL